LFEIFWKERNIQHGDRASAFLQTALSDLLRSLFCHNCTLLIPRSSSARVLTFYVQLESPLGFKFWYSGLVNSFDDKHRFVVDHVRFAVLTEPLISLYCMIQHRVADVPGRLSIVFAHHRFH
jgi:hypothetical protein